MREGVMRDDVREMRARMREAQEVKITNGPLMAVVEGRKHVTEALRDSLRRPGDGIRGEVRVVFRVAFRDTGAYDPVLKFHTRT